ncbi:AraC-type DNA-binding protein [Mucilaginibacter lappiensis]|uniref:AraC-like DNA-binding protein n=1 Tax=Mucilaginibacter lappiensis TaxID=354630 RepID=A0ABR6PIV2_9SPHI|nr:AraC family transcriptional regulator [Mucilaginibacter lappiensis]MBB6109660.1 AraC-like DNA-binding protein [Mucilaginibacter lappiensis]SIR10924.1 AraC-type DNA-binding protein [Mucilaginibacter lappiensis]
MATTPIPKKILARQHEITGDFLKAVDQHLDDLLQHKVMDMMEIRDFADQLHIHPTHLSNTIKLTTGRAPCFFFEEKIMRIAKKILESSTAPVAEIAAQLTFDPSNFTKFFKRFEGVTPKQYREGILIKQYEQVD